MGFAAEHWFDPLKDVVYSAKRICAQYFVLKRPDR